MNPLKKAKKAANKFTDKTKELGSASKAALKLMPKPSKKTEKMNNAELKLAGLKLKEIQGIAHELALKAQEAKDILKNNLEKKTKRMP